MKARALVALSAGTLLLLPGDARDAAQAPSSPGDRRRLRRDDALWPPGGGDVARVPTASPPPASGLRACPDAYDPAVADRYGRGSEVAVAGVLYRCNGFPYDAYCALVGYRPRAAAAAAAGVPWRDAWEEVAACATRAVSRPRGVFCVFPRARRSRSHAARHACPRSPPRRPRPRPDRRPARRRDPPGRRPPP